MTTTRLLTLDDIADQRAYERERDEFRARVIAVKKLRRISVGPVITLTFESRLTMRFQVQEMARAEKMVSDEQIQHELDVYNRLLPARVSSRPHCSSSSPPRRSSGPGCLVWSASSARCQLRIGGDAPTEVIDSTPEEEHEANLSRAETTSAVHYVRFAFTPEQVEAFTAQSGDAGRGPSRVPRGSPRYPAERRHQGRTRRRPGRRLSHRGRTPPAVLNGTLSDR